MVAGWCYIDALLNLIFPRKRKSIEGLTAVVTGGGHGIGKEIALGFAKKGLDAVNPILGFCNAKCLKRGKY